MSLQLSPETERLVEREIAKGRFESVDEIIRRGIRARQSESESERWKRHHEAIEWTRNFALHHPVRLNGLTIRQLIEEGRRM